MATDDDKFKKIRTESEELYEKIGAVRCPYFGEDVHFNSGGFQHLLFKAWNKTRVRHEQYTRLRLLPHAEKIIKNSHTLQEYDERNEMVRMKSSGGWNKIMKRVEYFAFISIVGDLRTKIVIRKVDGGVYEFHSIIPNWRTDKQNNGQNRKKLFTGNLKKD